MLQELFAKNSDFIKDIELQAKTLLQEKPGIDFGFFHNLLYKNGILKKYQEDFLNKSLAIKTKISSFILDCSHKSTPDFDIDTLCNLNVCLTNFISTSNIHTYPSNFKVDAVEIFIIGSGISGLLFAKYLDNLNVSATIFEKRNETEASSRFFKIAIKNTETLKIILGQSTYNNLLDQGGELEHATGILRIPIGTLQNIVKSSLSKKIQIYFGHELDTTKIQSLLKINKVPRILVMAAGSHTIKEFNLEQYYNYTEISEYKTSVNEMVVIEKSDKDISYSRKFIPGQNWSIIGETINTCEHFYNNWTKYTEGASIVDEQTKSILSELNKYEKKDRLSCKFVKSNGKTLNKLIPTYYKTYEITPTISLNQISYLLENQRTPIILLGDATGLAHPITISGSDKYIKNIPYLINLLVIYTHLLPLLDTPLKNQSKHLIKLFEDLFEYSTASNNLDVFLKTLLFAMYSEITR